MSNNWLESSRTYEARVVIKGMCTRFGQDRPCNVQALFVRLCCYHVANCFDDFDDIGGSLHGGAESALCALHFNCILSTG
jgi:hypothetical protein